MDALPAATRRAGSRDPAAGASDGGDACASAIALAGLALGLVSTGVVPLGPRAWGLALWQYLPPAAGTCACLALAALTSARVRAALLRLGAALSQRLPARSAARRGLVWFALALLLFALRERTLQGDARILLIAARAGSWFHAPDLGATLLFAVATRLADALGLEPLLLAQLLVCGCGLATIACVGELAGRIAPPARRAAVAALLLCGGVSRLLFGHVEVYAFVLLGASAYLLVALRCLRGESGPALPALVLGLAAWVHPSLLALAPSLPLAARLGARSRGAATGWLRASAWLALAAAPTLLFLLGVLALAAPETQAQLRAGLAELTGRSDAPTHWVLAPGATPGHATELALFSAAQLRFLANSFCILAPFAFPIVALHALRVPSSWWRRPELLLLATAAAGSALYALALRPMWGPYDWDLFSLTAFCFSTLAAGLLGGVSDATRFAHRTLAICGASLLAVSAPWIAIGVHPTRDAGPFSRPRIERAPDESAFDALGRHLAPWM